MRTSIWYRSEEKQPDKSDYYIAYRGWGMSGKSDGDSDYGYVYYDKQRDEWRDYSSSSMGHTAIVYYWTDATPDKWTDQDPPRTVLLAQRKFADSIGVSSVPAIQDAWEAVEEAIKRYETVKALCAKEEL
jgi:hypothetical protein